MTRVLPILSVLAIGLPTVPVEAQVKVQAQKKVQIQPKQIQVQPKPIQVQPGNLIGGIGVANDGGMALVKNKDVQADLKMNDMQIKAINDQAQQQEAALANLTAKDKIAKRKEFAEDNKKTIANLLTPQQTARLEQLKVQQKGMTAFTDAKIAKDLDITAEQRTKIAEIQKGAAAKRQDIIKANQGDPAARAKKLAELNKELVQDAVKSLTPPQQQKWKDIAGDPFQGTLPATGGFAGIILPRPGIQPKQIQPKQIQPKRIQIEVK